MPQSIQAPRAPSSHHKIQEQKAIKHGQFAHIAEGPEPVRRVRHKVTHCHLTRQDKGHGPGKQTKQKKKSTETFKYARYKHQRRQVRHGVRRGRKIKQLLAAVFHK